MLNYLAASTCPDCLFVVHQCARFSANPKLSHERAVKRIVRYLKGTRDEGLIIKPDTTAGVQCFVDADFFKVPMAAKLGFWHIGNS
jgi:histone deacetylase 1/2